MEHLPRLGVFLLDEEEDGQDQLEGRWQALRMVQAIAGCLGVSRVCQRHGGFVGLDVLRAQNVLAQRTSVPQFPSVAVVQAVVAAATVCSCTLKRNTGSRLDPKNGLLLEAQFVFCDDGLNGCLGERCFRMYQVENMRRLAGDGAVRGLPLARSLPGCEPLREPGCDYAAEEVRPLPGADETARLCHSEIQEIADHALLANIAL